MKISSFIKIYILTIFIFYGCQNDNQKNAELIRQLNPTDQFKSDVPAKRWSTEFLRFASREIALDSLNHGFDSIQLRIWNGCAPTARRWKTWLVTLILNKKFWSAEFSDLLYNQDSSGLNESLSRKITYRQPRSGWNVFITKLFKLKILSLPNFEEIKTYEDQQDSMVDGCGIIIEVATKKIYRVYEYNDPDYYFKNYKEAKNILEIIKLLENEFEIKYEESTHKNSGNKNRTDNN